MEAEERKQERESQKRAPRVSGNANHSRRDEATVQGGGVEFLSSRLGGVTPARSGAGEREW